MPHRILYMPHRRPTYLIRDPLDMYDIACRSPIRHVGIRSGMLVSDQACRSPKDLRSDMVGYLVSSLAYWSLIRSVGLQYGFPMGLR